VTGVCGRDTLDLLHAVANVV